MLEHIVNLTGLLVAFAALVISIYSWSTSSRAARNDVLAQVRDWGGDVVGLAADARALCLTRNYGKRDINADVNVLRARASALLDRGRFFFPNWSGIRPPVLDLVVIVYELLPGIAEQGDDWGLRAKAFHYLQAVFVSTLRQALNFEIAPRSIKHHEEHLANLDVPTLPGELLELLARNHDFELAFDERPLSEPPKRDAAY